MAVEHHVAHFVVTGEAMTEMARDLMLSDEPGKAYRLIADNLVGEGAVTAAMGILQGTHDLAGDSSVGLELVEAQDNEALRRYKADVAYIYAGRYRHRRGWLRPVAKVVRYGPNDAKWATDQVPQGAKGTSAMKRWARYRALYYCGEGETAEVLELPEEGKTDVIWETCSEAPHWSQPPGSFQEALDQALAAGRTLEERPSKVERDIEDSELREERKQKRATKAERAAAEKRQRAREKAWEKRIKEIASRVRARAGADTFPMTLKDGRTLTVPRAPFVRWALNRTAEKDQAPEWENVAPVGVKLQMDNPDHTDWVLGAGLGLDEVYNKDINDVVWDKAMDFQEEARAAKRPYPGIMAAIEHLNALVHKAATIVDAGKHEGTVGADVAVFPDSDADRVKELDGVRAVIVEQGGKLAHFAIVTKGRGITVMRHPRACELFPEGTRVQISPATGRVVIVEEDT